MASNKPRQFPGVERPGAQAGTATQVPDAGSVRHGRQGDPGRAEAKTCAGVPPRNTGRPRDLAIEIQREQTERHRQGLCVFCELPLRECWCGEDEPVEYRPVSDGSDEVGVA